MVESSPSSKSGRCSWEGRANCTAQFSREQCKEVLSWSTAIPGRGTDRPPPSGRGCPGWTACPGCPPPSRQCRTRRGRILHHRKDQCSTAPNNDPPITSVSFLDFHSSTLSLLSSVSAGRKCCRCCPGRAGLQVGAVLMASTSISSVSLPLSLSDRQACTAQRSVLICGWRN